ncbi:MAG TPA: cyclophilin-like fold protein [Chitinophagaceae bacterium]|nr:cyclophilin-like fold protein [Chitinophagaceae bacterium]
MKITIGKKTFDVVLFDNPTTTNFKKMLPLTLSMTELNGNEKYADLPHKISISPSNPGHIKAGDLMMYGSTTIVLFYKSFQTSYSYTPLGRIEDISGLEDAVGKRNVSVSFRLE